MLPEKHSSQKRPASVTTLMADGMAKATIVVRRRSTKAERDAAGEIQTYLWKMASVGRKNAAKLPIREESDAGSGTRLFVGRTKRARELGIDLKGRAEHSFTIRTVDDGIVLCGNDALGTEHAAYTFLEKYCGVRWFWPGETGEYVPDRPTLEIGAIDDTQEPDFRLTRLGHDPLWRKRNKLLRRIRHAGGHAWGKMVPPAEYGPEHPEYFALVKGTRQRNWKGYNGQHGYQLCTTNPEVVRLCVDYIRRYFDAHPNTRLYSVGANDGGGFCECKRCVALDVVGASNPDFPGKPVITDRIYSFTNAIAREIKKTHPDRHVVQFAYGYYSPAPRNVRPLDNVVPWITLNCEAHYHAATKRRQWNRIRQWSKLCSTIFVYEYLSHTWKLQMPRAMPKAIGESIRHYRKCGARLLSVQSGSDFATEGLNYYLMAKLLWDTSLNVDDLVDDYCEKAFGSAGGVMKKYFLRLEQLWADTTREPAGRCPGGVDQALAMFPSKTMKELKGYLGKASRLAEAGPCRRRVAFFLMGWRFWKLERQAFTHLKKLVGEGVILKFGSSGWKSKTVADLSTLNIPENKLRRLIGDTVSAWQERDRYVEKCKGTQILHYGRIRNWNSTDYRFHPVEALKKALAKYRPMVKAAR